MTTYFIGCIIALMLTMILDTIEFRSGVFKQLNGCLVILLVMTLLSWVGVAVAVFGLTLYVWDAYAEITKK